TSCADGADTWEWDGTKWILANVNPSACGSMGCPAPMPIYGHQMTYDPVRGRTILVGGTEGEYAGCMPNLSKRWEWDGQAWTQSSVPGVPPPEVSLPASVMVY